MIENMTRCGRQKNENEQITKRLTGEERKGKKNMANASINVIYDDVHKDTLVYLTGIVWHEAHNENGMGICFILSKGLVNELMLKLQMETQMAEMTQHEIDREQVLFDQMQQMGRDSQP